MLPKELLILVVLPVLPEVPSGRGIPGRTGQLPKFERLNFGLSLAQSTNNVTLSSDLSLNPYRGNCRVRAIALW